VGVASCYVATYEPAFREGGSYTYMNPLYDLTQTPSHRSAVGVREVSARRGTRAPWLRADAITSIDQETEHDHAGSLTHLPASSCTILPFQPRAVLRLTLSAQRAFAHEVVANGAVGYSVDTRRLRGDSNVSFGVPLSLALWSWRRQQLRQAAAFVSTSFTVGERYTFGGLLRSDNSPWPSRAGYFTNFQRRHARTCMCRGFARRRFVLRTGGRPRYRHFPRHTSRH